MPKKHFNVSWKITSIEINVMIKNAIVSVALETFHDQQFIGVQRSFSPGVTFWYAPSSVVA